MSKKASIGVLGVLLAMSSASYAQTVITGTYTATDTGSAGYIPTINPGSSGFLSSPFTESLTIGSTTTPTPFLLIDPISGSGSLGTLTGKVSVAFTFSDPSGSSVTGVTYSNGGDVATLTNGTVKVAANYELFYGTQTDCITWNSTTCTATGNTTTIGDTLVVSFADGTVLNVNLYNWSDWNMNPNISFKLVSGRTTSVPEPASLSLFGTAIAGLRLIRRTRKGSQKAGSDRRGLPRSVD